MSTKKVAFLGLTIALAMIFSYLEHLIPQPLPGVKLGLPNLVIVFLLYRVGWKEAVIVSLIRVLLVALLFGNVQSLLISLSGAVLSLTGMILLKKINLFSCLPVSILGGILHMVGQIVCACFVTSTAGIASLLPIYLVTGTIAGALIGLLSGLLIKRLEKYKFHF